MILREGFFSSIALLTIISCLTIPQIAWINPFVFFLAIFLAIFLNPLLWAFIALFSIVLGLLFVESIIGGIASLAKMGNRLIQAMAAGGIAATILGVILNLGQITSFISTIMAVIPGGKEILAIVFLVGILVPMVLKIMLFFIGLLLSIILVPFAISAISGTAYAAGFYLLFFFLLFYYYLYGNDLALYGIVIALASTSLLSSSIYLALGVAILSIVGGLLGIRAGPNIRDLIIRVAIIYYLASIGIYAGSAIAPLNDVFRAITMYGFLSPAAVIMLVFVMGVASGDLRWPKVLINLMAIYCIFAIFSGKPLEGWLFASQPFYFDTGVVDRAVNSFLSYFGTDAVHTFWMYRGTINILVGGFTEILTNIFHVANPMFLGFSVAFAFLIMLFLYDMMLGLTGYPIFEGVSRVVPALMESIKRPPIEKKAKEAAGVITGLAEAEERRKRAIEEETKKLEKIRKQREKLEKELEEKQKKLEEATKKEEEMKVWRLRAVVNELRARKERLERIERAKQEAIKRLAQRPTVTGEVQRSLETAREAFRSIMEKLRRKK